MKRLLSILSTAVLLGTMILASAVLPQAEKEANLLAYYNFSDAEQLGKDISGNKNHLTTQGAGTVTQADGPEAGTQSAVFDGSAVLAAEEREGRDFTDGLSSFTISYYAQIGGNTEIARAVGSGYNGSQDGFSYILSKWEDTIYVRPIVGDSPDGTTADATDHWGNCYEITGAADWHHYVLAYDADAKKVTALADGREIGSYVLTNTAHMNSVLCFALGGGWASWDTAPANGFVGALAEVKVFDGAVTDLAVIDSAGRPVESNEENAHLIAYYDFEESADLGRDVSGRNHRLEVFGGGLTSGTGTTGKGLNLDGGSLLYADADFTDALTDFTVSLYAKMGDKAGVNRLIGSGYNGAQDGFSLILAKNGENLDVRPIMGDSADGQQANAADHWGNCYTVTGGDDWHHYIMVYESASKTVTLLVDNVQTARYTLTNSAHMNSAISFAIGGSYASWNGGADYFKGQVDEVKMFDAAIYDPAVIAAAKKGIDPLEGALTVHSLFSDNLILQRGKPCPVWGTGVAGERVTVAFGEQTKTTEVSEDGSWQVTLDAMEASSLPKTMTIRMGDQTLTAANVLVGEVWLASGQSNMDWRVSQLPAEQQTAIQSAENNQIRQFSMAIRRSKQIPADVEGGHWDTCAADTVGSFSAVAYYFAAQLQEELGVPVGILLAAQGGSSIENWVDHQLILDNDCENPMYPADGTNSYNAMIAPLAPFRFTGMLWYQGEANIVSELQKPTYSQQFGLLQESYKALFGMDRLPVIQVQLPSFNSVPAGDLADGSGWAKFRYTQIQLSETYEDVYTAVTIDLGEKENIHPADKQPVGSRLADIAREKVYGASIHSLSPQAKTAAADQGRVTVTFQGLNNSLQLKNGDVIREVRLCDKYGKWTAAEAVIDGNTLVIPYTGEAPIGVSYCDRNYVEAATLFDGALPVAPFRFQWKEAEEEPGKQEGELIAYYNFADSANPGKDASGNGNDLEKKGTGSLAIGEGRRSGDKGLIFDGKTVLAAKEVDGKDFSDELKSFTVSYYARIGNNTEIARVISSGYNGTQDGFASIINKWENNLYVRSIMGDSPDGTTAQATDHWNDCYTLENAGADDWHHYVMAYDAETKTVTTYVDGMKAGMYTLTHDAHMDSTLCFAVGGGWGSWDTTPSNGFIGTLSEIKIFNGVVSDMAAIESAGRENTPDPEPDPEPEPEKDKHLIAYYNFADSANPGKDASGNGNDLEKKGTGSLAIGEGRRSGDKGLIFDGKTVLAAKEIDGKDFSDKLKSFTISYYAKIGNNTEVRRVISTGYDGSQDGYASMINKWENNLYVRSIVGDSPDGTPAGAVDHWNDCYTLENAGADDWHHYVTTYDAGTQTVTTYVDGKEVGRYTLTHSAHMDSALCFAVGGGWASWITTPTGGFIGTVSEVKVFDIAIHDMQLIEAAGVAGDSPETGDTLPVWPLAVTAAAATLAAAAEKTRKKRRAA